MQHQIKVRALVQHEGKLLFVAHRHEASGAVWWSPPGGTVEGAESIMACAVREVREETGLTIVPGRIVYVREYIDFGPQHHNLELYLVADSFSGNLGRGVDEGDGNLIEAVRFLSCDEVRDLTVFPDELRDRVWNDLHADISQTRYLGIHTRR